MTATHDEMPAVTDQPSRWHALQADDAVAAVESDRDNGLRAGEVTRRLAHFGPNALPEPPRRSAFAVFLRQFKSPLIYLLLGAAAIAVAVGERTDAIVIFVVVVLNAIIGAIQEGRAERAMTALQRLTQHKARVLRDGHETVIDARGVVPGDVLVLEAGDAIAADARLLHGAALQIAEAALTGESVPVSKDLRPLALDTALADRTNMVYAGTHVTAGRARAVVIATGPSTEIGHIAAMAGAAVEPKTPLERRIDQFGRYVIAAAVVVFIAIVGVGVARGIAFGEMLMIGVSSLVGMIPEGLPVAMTIALAIGVQRMARRRAIVRRLSAVETLGSTTVICSDKTGTLTRNEMTVTSIYLPGEDEVSVSGVGYAPKGQFLVGGKPVEIEMGSPLRRILEAAVLCNDSQLDGPDDRIPHWKPIGDPTEIALLTAAIKAGLIPSEMRSRFRRRAELPFDSAVKMMATQHESSDGRFVVLKGAPEVLLDFCNSVQQQGGSPLELDENERRLVRGAAHSMASRALRVLAVAVARDAEIDVRAGFEAFRGRATLLGLVGQIDPPRAEVAEAVSACRDAGIRPVVVTGDHEATGLAVATQLGIAQEGDIAVDGVEGCPGALRSLPGVEATAVRANDRDDHWNSCQGSRVRRGPGNRKRQRRRIVEARSRSTPGLGRAADRAREGPRLHRAEALPRRRPRARAEGLPVRSVPGGYRGTAWRGLRPSMGRRRP